MLSVLATIWLLHMAALVIPGANVLLVSHLSASGSFRSAAAATLGITAGAAVWASTAVLGVGALFVAFPTVRLLLQVVGAVYLLYVALGLWRSGGPGSITAGEPTVSMSTAKAFRLGVLTNLTNPKVALFFGSVFSASLPAHPSALLLCAAVALVIASTHCGGTFFSPTCSPARQFRSAIAGNATCSLASPARSWAHSASACCSHRSAKLGNKNMHLTGHALSDFPRLWGLQ